MIRCLHLVSFLLITLIRVQAEVVDTQAWEKRSPENTDDLLAIQKRLKELLPGAKKGLVGIEAMDGAGSGVVVSSNGLILTAAHVIGKTGKKMKVRFPDGKTASAISLGGSEISDAGMLQILDKGPWPFVEIAKNKNSKS